MDVSPARMWFGSVMDGCFAREDVVWIRDGCFTRVDVVWISDGWMFHPARMSFGSVVGGWMFRPGKMCFGSVMDGCFHQRGCGSEDVALDP